MRLVETGRRKLSMAVWITMSMPSWQRPGLPRGRQAEAVLGLWGSASNCDREACPSSLVAGGALDCDLPSVLAAERGLGTSLVAGQIALLDRVLVYTMDEHGVALESQNLPAAELAGCCSEAGDGG